MLFGLNIGISLVILILNKGWAQEKSVLEDATEFVRSSQEKSQTINLEVKGGPKFCPSSLFTKGLQKGCKPSSPFSSKILIFVSFSMPDISLKALAQEAKEQKAILIIRGLYD